MKPTRSTLQLSALLVLLVPFLTFCDSKSYVSDTTFDEASTRYSGDFSSQKSTNDEGEKVLEITLSETALDTTEVEAASSIIALLTFDNLQEGGQTYYSELKVNVIMNALANGKTISTTYSKEDLSKVSAKWSTLSAYFDGELEEPFENLYEFYDADNFSQQEVGSFIEDFKALNEKENFQTNKLIGFQIGVLSNNQKAIMYLVQKEFEKASIQFVYIFKYDSDRNVISGISTL